MLKSFRLPPFFRLPALRFRALVPALVPTLTAAEKTALLALALTLGSGGALRLWKHSGVTLGPVDDWESLRALVIRARETSPDAGAPATREADYPCLDDQGAGGFGNHRAGGPSRHDGEEGMMRAAGAAGAAPAEAGADRPDRQQGGAGKKPPARAVDLNTAGERALLTLPGIGPSTARAIIAHRAANGRFRSVDDLLRVKGIGPKKLETLRPFAKADAPPAADSAP